VARHQPLGAAAAADPLELRDLPVGAGPGRGPDVQAGRRPALPRQAPPPRGPPPGGRGSLTLDSCRNDPSPPLGGGGRRGAPPSPPLGGGGRRGARRTSVLAPTLSSPPSGEDRT